MEENNDKKLKNVFRLKLTPSLKTFSVPVQLIIILNHGIIRKEGKNEVEVCANTGKVKRHGAQCTRLNFFLRVSVIRRKKGGHIYPDSGLKTRGKLFFNCINLSRNTTGSELS